MVPGSTLRYGSNFIMFTRKPRLSSRQPIEAAARPLPKLDTTPPVTKTYFAVIAATSLFGFGIGRTGWAQSSMAELQFRKKRKIFAARAKPGTHFQQVYYFQIVIPIFWVDCSAAFSLISAENQVPLSRFDLARNEEWRASLPASHGVMGFRLGWNLALHSN